MVEESFDQFGKYLTGERDEFSVTFRAGEQITTLMSEVKTLLRKADAYELLYDRVIIPNVEEAANLKLPLGLDVTGTRLVKSARIIAPPQWVQEQVEHVLDEATPYFVGDRDDFEIHVELADRAEIALQQVKGLLREADAYDILYDEVVEPRVVGLLGEVVELPFGLSVTNEEILGALRRVAPVDWVQLQVENVIDEVGPYMIGETDRFATEVSLVDNKREAGKVIVELIDQRLKGMVESIPACQSADDLASALTNLDARGLPNCVPPNIPLSQFMPRLGIDVGGLVREQVLGRIPDKIRFTDAQLKSALKSAGAGENVDRVDDVRRYLAEGWSYTQEDLRNDLPKLDDSAIGYLDQARAFLTDGITYTDVEFREKLAEFVPSDYLGDQNPLTSAGMNAVDTLDSVRGLFKTFRSNKWIVYVPMLGVLIIIAFLGGRGWAGRLAWGAGFLFVSAGVIYLAFGPIYDSFAPQVFEEARARSSVQINSNEGLVDFAETAKLAVVKAIDTIESVVGHFIGGIASSSRSLAGIGGVVMAVALAYGFIMGTVKSVIPD